MRRLLKLIRYILGARRPFLIAAGVATALLAFGLISTLAGRPGRSLVPAMVATFYAHGLALAGVEREGRRVRDIVRVRGLPVWVLAQAEKNASKLGVAAIPGLAAGLVAFAAGSGVGPGTVGLLSANLAYQVGAFLGEFVVLGGSIRLARDSESWVAAPVGV